MVFTESEIIVFLLQYLLPLFRIAALFMAMPVMSSQLVPVRLRIILALLITYLVVPLIPEVPRVGTALSLELMVIIIREIAIGLSVGFVFQIAFQIFVLSGQYIAMTMGLGFASMNDPTNGVQTTVLSQFFLLLVTLLFIVVNGHLVIIEMIIESFRTLPVGESVLDPAVYFSIVKLGAWMFLTALIFSLPLLASILFINITFGVMSRAAPQLNIFAVGFPFTLVSGLFLIYLGLTNFESGFEMAMERAFDFTRGLLELN